MPLVLSVSEVGCVLARTSSADKPRACKHAPYFSAALTAAMPGTQEFLLGEFQRTLDERYRLSIPSEVGDALAAESPNCILAKERPGCLSLWSAPVWQARLDEGVELVKQKMRAGKLQERIAEVQLFGRLLSTRHRLVQLAGRGRLVIPEGFREFLGGRAGRRGADRRGGRVRRNLATGRLAQVSRRPHAPLPAAIRSIVKVGCVLARTRVTLTPSATTAWVHPPYANHKPISSMLGPAYLPTSGPRQRHRVGAASHQGWIFSRADDAPTHPYPGPSMDLFLLHRDERQAQLVQSGF